MSTLLRLHARERVGNIKREHVVVHEVHELTQARLTIAVEVEIAPEPALKLMNDCVVGAPISISIYPADEAQDP